MAEHEAEASEEPVLSLSTTSFKRSKVAIDEVLYEIRAPEELTLALVQRMGVVSEKLKEVDDKDYATIGKLMIDQLCLVMVKLPRAVASKLVPKDQAAILKAFTKLAGEMDGSPTSAETS